MHKYMGLSDAALKYGVNRRTLISRLARDEASGGNLHGCVKVGKVWAVTDDYMKNWRDARKNS